MIDIHNNELFSICHFARLALNPTRSGRLLPYVRMCVCMCIHTHVCRYVYRRTDVHTGVVIGAELWVSSIYIRTRTHILMWVTRAGITHMHTYVHIYIRTSHVRAPQGKLIKVCYKKIHSKSPILSCKYIFDFPFDFFFASCPRTTPINVCDDLDALRCVVICFSALDIHTADKIYYVHMPRCMFLGACMYAEMYVHMIVQWPWPQMMPIN